ncbi:MAG: hypothetical protein LKI58_08250 [Actinomyces sp.]|nr:hypothetical protein [Actinomyces sp.]MCI1788041.1 hypothetical protein [Actinomyces sp.]MCI1830590.1 hypothetical protein [Actinomyces sp.]
MRSTIMNVHETIKFNLIFYRLGVLRGMPVVLAGLFGLPWRARPLVSGLLLLFVFSDCLAYLTVA